MRASEPVSRVCFPFCAVTEMALGTFQHKPRADRVSGDRKQHNIPGLLGYQPMGGLTWVALHILDGLLGHLHGKGGGIIARCGPIECAKEARLGCFSNGVPPQEMPECELRGGKDDRHSWVTAQGLPIGRSGMWREDMADPRVAQGECQQIWAHPPPPNVVLSLAL